MDIKEFFHKKMVQILNKQQRRNTEFDAKKIIEKIKVLENEHGL